MTVRRESASPGCRPGNSRALDQCTRAEEPLPEIPTRSTSRSGPNTRVSARIRTGITLPLRLPTDSTRSDCSVAVAVAACSAAVKAAGVIARREPASSSEYISA